MNLNLLNKRRLRVLYLIYLNLLLGGVVFLPISVTAQSPVPEPTVESNPDCPGATTDCKIPRDPFALAILTPHGGRILGDRLTIRWTPVQGATSYEIYVPQFERRYRHDDIENTVFEYPLDERLEPNRQYTIIVSAYIPRAARPDTPIDPEESIRFSVSSPEKIEQVCQAVKGAGEPDDVASALAIAEIYEQNELFADAFVLLKTYEQEFGSNDAISQELDKLAEVMGLPNEPDESERDLRQSPAWATGSTACRPQHNPE